MTDTTNTADVSGDSPRIENAPVPRDADAAKPRKATKASKPRKADKAAKTASKPADKDTTYIVGHDGKRVALDKYRESDEFVKGFDPVKGE